jgi:hypothetical protein
VICVFRPNKTNGLLLMLFLPSLKRSYPVLAGVWTALFLPAFCLAQTATENCTNGADDDGDGLIDCYDQDCTCTGQCDDFYYTTCNADCYYIPPCGQISLGVQWVSQAETGNYSVLVAGDMDQDGVPEIVTYRVESPDIFIINGATGATKVHIVGPTIYQGGTAPAIADLDNDGFGELVISGNDRIVRCYSHTGVLKWESAAPVGYGGRYSTVTINIADFDHNGQPELNIGNQVFSGQTGALLAEAGPNASAGEHPARVSTGWSFCQPVAIDALPDNFCADCDGLEIVAGNQVMSVNLVTGAVTVINQAPPQYRDGFTSVVDFDRDGDLDAIVQGKRNNQNTIYCWDLLSGTVIRQYQLPNNYIEGASRANVADLDGDGQLELSFVGHPRLFALENNFTVKWTRNINDQSSITSSSVFDFCGDGSVDIIYRGNEFLQVLNGATGQIAFQDECVSATHIENPLVLDVDADGQTEIVIQCSDSNMPDSGYVVVYEAVGTPGIASRKVWNQHAYFNTNINEDLSVPRYQQNPHIVGDSLKLNTFLNQFFNPTFPSPDGVLTIDSAITCAGDSLAVTLTLCNPGDNILPPQTPLSIYRGNPQTTPATWLGAFPLGFALAGDSCRTFTAVIPRVANDSIFIVLNDNHTLPAPYSLDDDFPVTSIGECSFTNNIVGLYFAYAPETLALGADTTICHNGTLELDATGPDLVDYTWQDATTASTFTAPGPGTYSVTVTDLCGLTQTDEIVITLDTATVVRLGADRTICAGESVVLGENNFDTYSWSPASAVDCPTCAVVQANPAASTNVVLTGSFTNGCVSRDTVFIAVNDTFNYVIDTTICYGRTVTWNNVDIAPDSAHTFFLQTVSGCDSTVQVRVHGTALGTFQITVDTAVCLGQTLPFINLDLEPGDQQTFYLTASTGCDSTVLVNVAARDTFATAEALTICAGETATVFGQPLGASATVSMTFTALNGCDSTHTVALTVLDPIMIELNGTATCPNETTGELSAIVTGSAPPFTYAWTAPASGNTPDLNGLPAGSYALTVTDAENCTETATAAVPAYPPIELAVATDSVDCFGQSDGVLTIDAPDSTLLFSLNGSPFSDQRLFSGLTAGPYVVEAEDINGCHDTISSQIYEPPQLLLSLPPAQSLNLGDSLLVDTDVAGLDPFEFQWSDSLYLSCADCPSPLIKPLESRRYTLTVTDANGCTTSGELDVAVTRFIRVFLPNAVAPESANDFNRRFQPFSGSAVNRIVVFRIFDRWGALLHEVANGQPNDPANAWDGRSRGKYVDPGVYVWFLEVELVDGARETYRGDVTVVR